VLVGSARARAPAQAAKTAAKTKSRAMPSDNFLFGIDPSIGGAGYDFLK
jgi:hypothetical protein